MRASDLFLTTANAPAVEISTSTQRTVTGKSETTSGKLSQRIRCRHQEAPGTFCVKAIPCNSSRGPLELPCIIDVYSIHSRIIVSASRESDKEIGLPYEDTRFLYAPSWNPEFAYNYASGTSCA